MQLYHRDLGGQGRPIVILHGLFGSSKNWVSAGRALSPWGRVYALDQRNHGRSPHAPSHSLADLTADLGEWIGRHLAEPPVLIGHSMGGLAAMAFALQRPGRAGALVVVDIAPRVYPQRHEPQLRALGLDLSGFATRAQIDRALESLLPDPKERQFLLMSAERAGAEFRWVLNRQALERATFAQDFGRIPAASEFRGPALFLLGGRSDHVRPEDLPEIRRRFPAARIETVPGADHWLHHSAPGEFRRLVGGFLESLP